MRAHVLAEGDQLLTGLDRSVDPYRANILFSATESAVQK